MSIKSGLMLVGALTALAGCGTESGYLYESQLVQQNDVGGARPEFSLTKANFRSVTWYMPCDASDVPPVADPGHLVIVGPGPHQLPRERLVGSPIIFKGRLCAPRGYDRDVVIGVDISGSMVWGDPIANNTCARRRAVEAALDTLPPGSKMGLFTFGDGVEWTQMPVELFNSKAELLAAATADGRSLTDVLCDVSGGRSDFKVALDRAKTYLELGRGNGTKKELLLISDGSPQGLPIDVAAGVADELRSRGVNLNGERLKTIVSAAVIGTGDRFLTRIVSADPAGANYYVPAAQAADVVRSVGRLADNALAEAKLDYRIQGRTAWQAVDMLNYVSGGVYTLPQFTLSIDPSQGGYESKLFYKDTQGNLTTVTGSIVWTD